MHRLLHFDLNATLLPYEPEISLPPGAPGMLCLYADFRPHQLDTLVYLCNAGPTVLTEVEVAIDSISMFQFHKSTTGDPWAEVQDSNGKRWEAVRPRRCVLANTLSHFVWDEVNRYRLTFTDAAGRRRTADVHDRTLNASRLAQNPDRVWVTFDIAK